MSYSATGERERNFASDNNAGICPEAWAAMAQANGGHAAGYGDDPWTEAARDAVQEFFETDCRVFFVSGGTVANALGLAALARSFEAVYCHRFAHIEVDECGAPEFFTGGAKLVTMDGADGKIAPEALAGTVHPRDFVHFPAARVLCLTQATEAGTVYRPEEVAALSAAARELEMKVFMDGARLANAAAALDCSPADFTWRAGVDALSLGGTKNGLGLGEAVVFFDLEAADGFDRRMKQAGQLTSKMRFLTAPWTAYLKGDVWLRYARLANARAAQLASGLVAAGISPCLPRETNAVYVRFADTLSAGLHERGWRFYRMPGFDADRLMCSWDTTEGDIDAFLTDVRELTAGKTE